jgi:hypothetical protein
MVYLRTFTVLYRGDDTSLPHFLCCFVRELEKKNFLASNCNLFFSQSQTEYNEWLKELNRSYNHALEMMRTGAKIIGGRLSTQSSKDETA